MAQRLRGRMPLRLRHDVVPGRSTMLLRGLGRFVAVVVAAEAVGVGLGIGMSKLTGSGPAPVSPPLGATDPAPSRTTAAPPAAATGPKLRVDVLAAVAHPILGASTDRALLSVHVRVKNAIGRAIRPKPPVLVVNGARVPVAPSASAAALRVARALHR
jgi:hypothetical protein